AVQSPPWPPPLNRCNPKHLTAAPASSDLVCMLM
ncbi:hypothetical protein A2U01_0047108, partial [Trifolium medium]|nr:hypothetical protein [Trifolium medium]